jgi:amino acid transporter
MKKPFFAAMSFLFSIFCMFSYLIDKCISSWILALLFAALGAAILLKKNKTERMALKKKVKPKKFI